jgi:hypothetical protein
LHEEAMILDKRSLRRDWDEAHQRLLAATRLLEPRVGLGAAEVFALASALELLGEVQFKRERFRGSRTALQRAQNLYATLDTRESKVGKQRVEETLKKFDEPMKDPEEPGDE